MTVRPWLRHPPRTIRPPVCPTGQPRYSSRQHASHALLPGISATQLALAQCPLPECGGWHHSLETL
jgi:hypothetical protein